MYQTNSLQIWNLMQGIGNQNLYLFEKIILFYLTNLNLSVKQIHEKENYKNAVETLGTEITHCTSSISKFGKDIRKSINCLCEPP